MAEADRYPELDVYEVANKALEDFDARHEAQKNAIEALAPMLRKSGWAGVKLNADDAGVPPAGQIRGDIEPISVAALEGDSVFQIVTRSRLLEGALLNAYTALPEEIRGAVSPPPARAT